MYKLVSASEFEFSRTQGHVQMSKWKLHKNKLLQFILRTTQNTQTHSVTRMQSAGMLKQVVCIVVSELSSVKNMWFELQVKQCFVKPIRLKLNSQGPFYYRPLQPNSRLNRNSMGSIWDEPADRRADRSDVPIISCFLQCQETPIKFVAMKDKNYIKIPMKYSNI